MKNLIDISHWNAVNAWDKVQSDPQVDGMMIKLTHASHTVDPNAHANVVACNLEKIPFGVYHYATMFGTAQEEAGNLIANIKTIANGITLPVALDLEENKSGKDTQQVEQWGNDFFAELNSHGYSNVVLYTNKGFVQANLSPSHSLGKYPLWHSQYPNRYIPGMNPDLPNGWDKCWAWQYCQNGSINGIVGNVDKSVITQS